MKLKILLCFICFISGAIIISLDYHRIVSAQKITIQQQDSIIAVKNQQILDDSTSKSDIENRYRRVVVDNIAYRELYARDHSKSLRADLRPN